MAHDAESSGAPRGDELVNPVPAIEADAIRSAFQHAIDLCEGGFEPRGVVVVVDALSVAAMVANHIGRVRQHEFDTGGCEAAKDIDAVALQDSVAGGRCEFGHDVPLWFE